MIEDKTADWTFAVVLPATEPEIAEIVTEPRARAVANPPAGIDTTLLFDELQVTEPVISCWLPSENVPVAVNCWSVPMSKTASAGVTAIETKTTLVALVTVRVAVAETLPELAVIVAEPAEWLVARPEPEIVATPVLDEAQVTESVISLVDPSL